MKTFLKPNTFRYRQGLEKILITTNVLSRGIDIEQVDKFTCCSSTQDRLITGCVNYPDFVFALHRLFTESSFFAEMISFSKYILIDNLSY